MSIGSFDSAGGDERLPPPDNEGLSKLKKSKSKKGHSGSANSSSVSLSRTVRGQMSFILEEDEGGEGAGNASGSSSGHHLIAEDVYLRTRTSSLPPATAAASSSRLSVVSSSTSNYDPTLDHRRRSTLSIASASSSTTRPRPASVLSRSSSTSSATTTTAYNKYQRSSRTVDLPFPNPRPSSHPGYATGYSSLTLPRASFAPSKHPDRVSSAIDITKSGLAQTSMGVIEITSGASSHSSRWGKGRERDMPAHLLARERAGSTPLGYTSRRPPPNKLLSSQVLVQVFSVGLDALDALVVRDRSRGDGGFGWVPGRSFVGRAVEVGYEVRNCCMGEWVFGLLDLSKVRPRPSLLVLFVNEEGC